MSASELQQTSIRRWESTISIPTLEQVRYGLAALCDAGVQGISLSLYEGGEWRQKSRPGHRITSAEELRDLVDYAEQAAVEAQCQTAMRIDLAMAGERVVISGKPGSFWYIIHLLPEEEVQREVMPAVAAEFVTPSVAVTAA